MKADKKTRRVLKKEWKFCETLKEIGIFKLGELDHAKHPTSLFVKNFANQFILDLDSSIYEFLGNCVSLTTAMFCLVSLLLALRSRD